MGNISNNLWDDIEDDAPSPKQSRSRAAERREKAATQPAVQSQTENTGTQTASRKERKAAKAQAKASKQSGKTTSIPSAEPAKYDAEGNRMSEKPKERMGKLKKTRVLYEGDVKATRRRFIPSDIRAAIIYLICLAVIVWAGVEIGKYVYGIVTAEASFSTIIEDYTEPEPVPVEQQDPDLSAWPPIINWDELKSQCPNVGAWIRIPGTTVDYPVVVNTTTDENYYLSRDIYGNASGSGCIFFDKDNTKDFENQNHWVIYGHHMVPPTMFHDVARMREQAFFDEHRLIFIETPTQTYLFKTIRMYMVEPSEYNTRKVIFDYSNDFQSYFDKRIIERGGATIAQDDYPRLTNDRLLTLITCDDNGTSRQIVEAVPIQVYPTSMIPNVIKTALAERGIAWDAPGQKDPNAVAAEEAEKDAALSNQKAIAAAQSRDGVVSANQ